MTKFFAKVSALKKFTSGVLAANTGITADTWAAGNDPRITGALAANDLGAAIADLAMSEATPLNETLAAAVEREVAIAGQFLVVGAAAVFTATVNGGTWDPSIRLRITDHADAEQAFTPSLIETFDGPWSLATWELTIEQVAAIRGTKTVGSLHARITTGTGDALRPWAAGRISIVSAYVGSSAAQSLGTVTLGPAGPGVAAAGTAGQALLKTSGTDYATHWGTLTDTLVRFLDTNGDPLPAGSLVTITVNTGTGEISDIVYQEA